MVGVMVVPLRSSVGEDHGGLTVLACVTAVGIAMVRSGPDAGGGILRSSTIGCKVQVSTRLC